MHQYTILLGLIAASSAFAGEYPIAIKSDLKVEYFVVEKGGSPEQPSLLLKRVRPGGTSFSKRLFDCEASTYQQLGSWATLDAMVDACPESEMQPVEEGSIAYQLWQHACGKAEIQAKLPVQTK